MLVAAVSARQPVAQLQIAVAVRAQQQHAKRCVALGLVREPDVAARDRLQSALARGAVELDQSEDVRKIGQRERGHRVGRSGRDRVVDPERAVGDRELAVQAQVDEGGVAHARGSGMHSEFERGPLGSNARILLPSSALAMRFAASHERMHKHAATRLPCHASSRHSLVALLLVGACATVPESRRRSRRRCRAPPSRRRRRSISPAFRCPTGKVSPTVAPALPAPSARTPCAFRADGNYRTGWQDGLAQCRKKK